MNIDVHLHAFGVRRYVGRLAEQDGQKERILFQYAPEFLTSGIELSPFTLPLGPEVMTLPHQGYHI